MSAIFARMGVCIFFAGNPLKFSCPSTTLAAESDEQITALIRTNYLPSTSMPKEATATQWVKEWFELQACYVAKNDDVDWEVRDNRHTLTYVVEVKGEQRNDYAYRNQFFMGLGQAFIVSVSHPKARVLLALTTGYRPWVMKYADVLCAKDVGVLWIKGPGDIERADLEPYRTTITELDDSRRVLVA
jgi:hypothetical protein